MQETYSKRPLWCAARGAQKVVYYYLSVSSGRTQHSCTVRVKCRPKNMVEKVLTKVDDFRQHSNVAARIHHHLLVLRFDTQKTPTAISVMSAEQWESLTHLLETLWQKGCRQLNTHSVGISIHCTYLVRYSIFYYTYIYIYYSSQPSIRLAKILNAWSNSGFVSMSAIISVVDR